MPWQFNFLLPWQIFLYLHGNFNLTYMANLLRSWQINFYGAWQLYFLFCHGKNTFHPWQFFVFSPFIGFFCFYRLFYIYFTKNMAITTKQQMAIFAFLFCHVMANFNPNFFLHVYSKNAIQIFKSAFSCQHVQMQICHELFP